MRFGTTLRDVVRALRLLAARAERVLADVLEDLRPPPVLVRAPALSHSRESRRRRPWTRGR